MEAPRMKWEKSDSDRKAHSQYSVTARCLFEGDAELTERLYAEQVFGSDWQEQLQEERAQAEEDEGATSPAYLVRAELFDYWECEDFVTSLYDEGGWELVNQAYKKPPATTEQVLHPEKYRSGQLGNGQRPRDLLSR